MAKYLVYARALQVLKSNLASRSGSSFASWEYRGVAMLLSTYPPLCVQTSVTSSWALGLGDRHGEAVVTFVVKKLPTYYTQEMFVSELVESGFKGQFDLLYIPCHPEQGCNIAYAIVTLSQRMPAEQFRASFPHKSLDEQTRMTGEGLVVKPAPTQGYEANYYHFALKWSGSPPLGRPQLCPLQPSEAACDACATFGHFQ